MQARRKEYTMEEAIHAVAVQPPTDLVRIIVRGVITSGIRDVRTRVQPQLSGLARAGAFLSPSFLQFSEFALESQVINSEPVVRALVDASDVVTANVVQYRGPEKGNSFLWLVDDDKLAKGMTQLNTRFFGYHTLGYFMATFGPRFWNNVPLIGLKDAKDKPLLGSAEKIARGFSEPKSVEQIVDRLSFLFTVDGHTSPAFRALIEGGDFSRHVKDGDEMFEKSCPAGRLTKVLYDTYGEVLGDRTYRKELVQRLRVR